MAFFKYTAKNEHGETVKGKVEARSVKAAAALLNSRGLLLLHVSALNEASLLSLRSLVSGIKFDDIVNITRQLSTMITAGLPLSTALSILAEQSSQELSALVNEILRDIESGLSFSKSLEKRPKHFSRVYIQLVRAGEMGGVLDQVLDRLAETMEKQKDFRSKTRGALIYPAIVLAAMLIVASVMMIFVIPKLTEMYQDFGAELPAITQALIDISGFFTRFWWVMLTMLFGGGFFLHQWRKTSAGEHAIDRFLLKIPVFGVLRKKVILTEFARTLALLLSAGVSLLDGLEIVTESVSNIIYRDALAESTSRVEKGIPLSQALSAYKEFPPILYQMVGVGEETGKLDDVLLKLSAYFEAESEQAVKNMTTALEPFIMIVLGVGVGFMVVAIIMPIYSLTSQF